MSDTLTIGDITNVYKSAGIINNMKSSEKTNSYATFSGNSYYDFCEKYSIYENNLSANNVNE